MYCCHGNNAIVFMLVALLSMSLLQIFQSSPKFSIFSDSEEESLYITDHSQSSSLVDPFGLFHHHSATKELGLTIDMNDREMEYNNTTKRNSEENIVHGGPIPWSELYWLKDHSTSILERIETIWRSLRASTSSKIMAEGRFTQWCDKANRQCHLCATHTYHLLLSELSEQFEFAVVDYVCEICVFRSLIFTELADLERATVTILIKLAEFEDTEYSGQIAAKNLDYKRIIKTIQSYHLQKAVCYVVCYWFHIRDSDSASKILDTLQKLSNILESDIAHYVKVNLEKSIFGAKFKHDLKCPSLASMLQKYKTIDGNNYYTISATCRDIDLTMDSMMQEHASQQVYESCFETDQLVERIKDAFALHNKAVSRSSVGSIFCSSSSEGFESDVTSCISASNSVYDAINNQFRMCRNIADCVGHIKSERKDDKVRYVNELQALKEPFIQSIVSTVMQSHLVLDAIASVEKDRIVPPTTGKSAPLSNKKSNKYGELGPPSRESLKRFAFWKRGAMF